MITSATGLSKNSMDVQKVEQLNRAPEEKLTSTTENTFKKTINNATNLTELLSRLRKENKELTTERLKAQRTPKKKIKNSGSNSRKLSKN